MNADNDLVAVDTNTKNKLHQRNQVEDAFFSYQSLGTGVPAETLHENHDHKCGRLTHLQPRIEHVADANPNDTDNLDESALQYLPLNQDTLRTGNTLRHMDDLHIGNCQEQAEHPNGASSSAVGVESGQRSGPTKSVFRRRSQNKKGRSNFSEAAKNILRSFYSKNPYPEKNDVSDLAGRAKLTPKQIRVWFSNKRNREESSGKSRNPLSNKICSNTNRRRHPRSQPRYLEKSYPEINAVQLGLSRQDLRPKWTEESKPGQHRQILSKRTRRRCRCL